MSFSRTLLGSPKIDVNVLSLSVCHAGQLEETKNGKA